MRTIPLGYLTLGGMVLGVTLFVQWLGLTIANTYVEVGTLVCESPTWKKKDQGLAMNIKCDGQAVTITNQDAIAAILNAKGNSINCTELRGDILDNTAWRCERSET